MQQDKVEFLRSTYWTQRHVGMDLKNLFKILIALISGRYITRPKWNRGERVNGVLFAAAVTMLCQFVTSCEKSTQCAPRMTGKRFVR